MGARRPCDPRRVGPAALDEQAHGHHDEQRAVDVVEQPDQLRARSPAEVTPQLELTRRLRRATRPPLPSRHGTEEGPGPVRDSVAEDPSARHERRRPTAARWRSGGKPARHLSQARARGKEPERRRSPSAASAEEHFQSAARAAPVTPRRTRAARAVTPRTSSREERQRGGRDGGAPAPRRIRRGASQRGREGERGRRRCQHPRGNPSSRTVVQHFRRPGIEGKKACDEGCLEAAGGPYPTRDPGTAGPNFACGAAAQPEESAT